MAPYPQAKPVLASAVAILLQLVGAAGAVAQNPTACSADPGLATLVHRVADQTTRLPLAAALVTASWRENDRIHERRARTDSAGQTVLCIPVGRTITINSSYAEVNSAPLTTFATGPGITTQMTVIDAPSSLVRGRVIDQQTGSPIGHVFVHIGNGRVSTFTNAEGRFVFDRVPVGRYQLRAEHLGYAMSMAALNVEHEDLDALVHMAPAAISLQPVVVTAFSRRLEQVGFYERQKRGVGTFINRKQIDAMNAQDASDLLRAVPSLRLIPQNRRNSGQPRNATVGRRGNCRFTFIVDGSRTLGDFEMDFVAAAALEGIEVYNGLAEVPAAFRAHASTTSGQTVCGVIALWTRNSR